MNGSLNQNLESNLLRDNANAKKGTSSIQKIKCPSCGKKEAFVNLDKGLNILCGRMSKCGAVTPLKDVYPDLFKNLSGEEYLKSRRLKPDCINFESKKWFDKPTGKSYNSIALKLNDDSEYHILTDYPDKNNKRMPKGAGQLVFEAFTETEPKEVFVVESPLCALSLRECNYSSVSVLSSNFSQEDYFLKHKDRKYILGFDDDEAGLKATHKWIKFFKKNNIQYDIAIPFGAKDWNDLLQIKPINDAKIKECLWYGRLKLSESAQQYYEIWCEKHGDYPLVFPFGNQLYRGHIKISRNTPPERLTKKLVDADIQICQTMEEYSDRYNKTVTHRLKISKKNKKFVCEVNANELITKNSLRSVLIKYDVVIWATDDELMYLIQHLVRGERPVIRKVNHKGYDEKSNCYVYENYLFDEHGKKHSINSDGYFNSFNIAPFTDSDLDNIEITETKPIDISKVFELFSNGYGGRGFTILSFWIATLFSHIIFSIKKEFGILNIYGHTHKGKSFLAKICFWMLGIDDEGISADNTRTGNIRKMSQYRGIPIQFNEVERSVYLKSGLNIKNVFHWRALKTMGEKNNRNTTKTLRCETGVAFNNNPDIFTLPEEKNRTVSIYFPEDCSKNTFKFYEELSLYDKEQFAYIGEYIRKNRKYFESHLKEAVLHYSNQLKEISEADERLRNSHAQVLGTFHVLVNLLSDKGVITLEDAKMYLTAEIEYIKEILKSRIDEIRTSDTLVGRFFELLLNEPENKETGYKTDMDKLYMRPNIATHYIINKHRLRWSMDNLKQTLRDTRSVFIEANKNIRYDIDTQAKSYVFNYQKIKELIGIG